MKLLGKIYATRSGKYRWLIQTKSRGEVRDLVRSGGTFKSRAAARRMLMDFCREVSLAGVKTVEGSAR
ncbi:MAG: hypothetical protein ACREFI_11010 [Stellaceae bacterium]